MVKRVAKRVAIFCLGWALILAGLVLSLPLVPGPGFLVILIGLLVLASEYHWAHRILESIRRRVPRLAAYEARAKERAREWFGRKVKTV